MIVVCHYANYTCCSESCCDGMTGFGHASMYCTSNSRGLSVGSKPTGSNTKRDFFDRQREGKFGTIVAYACIPTRADRLPQVQDASETDRLVAGLSEDAVETWWLTTKHSKAGGADCADLVFEALAAAGANSTYAWSRTLSRPLYTPAAAVSYGAAIAQTVCNAHKINEQRFREMLTAANLGIDRDPEFVPA